VNVRDTVAPVLTVARNPGELWSPNHRLVPVQVSWQIADLCSTAPPVLLRSVTSSEPDDAPGDGDGATTGDVTGADLGTPDTAVSLRAERNGAGPGRQYDLVYESVDAAGNVARQTVSVTVPHDSALGNEPLQLRLQPETAGRASILWSPVSGATGYDLIRGDLANVVRGPNLLSLGTVSVLAAGSTATDFLEPAGSAAPAAGKVFFYVMQYREPDGSRGGYGTESGALPREPASCGSACP
jgi:hypothetical protein